MGKNIPDPVFVGVSCMRHVDCTMAWCCSVVLFSRFSAIVVRVSSRGVGISSLSLLRHNNSLSMTIVNTHSNQSSTRLHFFGPVGEVHESAYNEITGEMIREAALRTKGAGGPSNVDANGFKGFLLANHSRSLPLICATLLQL